MGSRDSQIIYQLTPTEVRVVELLVKGVSVAEAARELGQHRGDGSEHLARIFSKTGTTRQAELIVLAVRTAPPGLHLDDDSAVGRC